MYEKYIKRFLDFFLSLLAIIVLFPFFVILAIVGTIKMKGNPFFVQERPGLHEKIFKIYKFRTMSNEKDADGNYMPDEVRLNNYGRFLRTTSLDELPELWNILVGEMSIVGPRPLLVKYLPLYNDEQHHRHDVRPGLTGYAQTHGRNQISWEEKFRMDVWYSRNVSFWIDMSILIRTIYVVLKHTDINSEMSETVEEFKGNKI